MIGEKQAWNSADLTNIQKAILETMASFENPKTGIIKIGHAAIADKLNLSINTVHISLKVLIIKGLVIRAYTWQEQ